MKNKLYLLVMIVACTFYLTHQVDFDISKITNNQVFAQVACDDYGSIIWGSCSSASGTGIQYGDDDYATYSRECCTPNCTNNKCGGVSDGCGGACNRTCCTSSQMTQDEMTTIINGPSTSWTGNNSSHYYGGGGGYQKFIGNNNTYIAGGGGNVGDFIGNNNTISIGAGGKVINIIGDNNIVTNVDGGSNIINFSGTNNTIDYSNAGGGCNSAYLKCGSSSDTLNGIAGDNDNSVNDKSAITQIYACNCNRNCTGKCGGASDGCGGACWDGCGSGQACSGGSCVAPTPIPCTPNCAGKCGGADNCCGGTCWNACAGGQVCSGGSCIAPTPTPIPCAPDCSTKCGGETNGCGGTCPSPCSPYQACFSGGICCTPDCEGKCGGAADSCGGTCESACSAGQVCNTGTCCIPDCSVKCGGTPATNCDGLGVCDNACPAPVTIGGNFKENLTGDTVSCDNSYTYSNITPIISYISLQNPTNKTLACTSTTTSYSCDVTFQTLDDPTANLVLKQTQLEYNIYWDCPDSSITKSISSGQTISNDIYFSLENQNWFKLKTTSFNSVSNQLNIPLNVLPYDSSDDGAKRIIIGDAGIITNSSATFRLTNSSSAEYSQYNQKISNYTDQNVFGDLKSIASYTKNKNKNKTIVNLSEISSNYPEYTNFIMSGNVTIKSSDLDTFKDKSIFLIVDGTVNFANDLSGNFQPVNSNIAIAAKTIKFYTTEGSPATGSVKDAHGIFMAETIDTGTDHSNGLKITGNLISLGGNPIQNKRIAGSNQKPGVYVVFDPQMYMGLLGTLSNRIFNWIEQ